GNGSGGSIKHLPDAVFAFSGPSQDMRSPQFLRVRRRPRNERILRPQDAMPPRLFAGFDSRVLERNDFALKHGNDPANGTYKSFWLSRAPIHVLGPVERSDFFGQILSQHLSGTPPLLCDCGSEVIAFGRTNFLQVRDIYAGSLREG